MVLQWLRIFWNVFSSSKITISTWHHIIIDNLKSQCKYHQTMILNYHQGLMSSINHKLKLTPPVSDLLRLVDCFTFRRLSQMPYYWITILASAFDMLWTATIGININEGFISEGRNLKLVSKESFSGVTETLFCSTGPFYLPSGNGDLYTLNISLEPSARGPQANSLILSIFCVFFFKLVSSEWKPVLSSSAPRSPSLLCPLLFVSTLRYYLLRRDNCKRGRTFDATPITPINRAGFQI